MLLIVRDGHSLPARGQTFRDFIAHGHDDFRATVADWNVHLTTLFPEVRLKRVIETRGTDAVPGAQVCSLPAFWKGLLYDDLALEAALARVRGWTHAQVHALHGEVARVGLQAQAPDAPLLDVARDLVALSRDGLRRQAVHNAADQDETLYLEPLEVILESGRSPARTVLERWNGPWQRAISKLIEYAKY
jgi:glutamate--cysteine ligase